MPSTIYFLSSSRDSTFPQILRALCEGALVIKVSTSEKSVRYSQIASRAGAQNMALQQLCAASERVHVGAFARTLNDALNAYEQRLYKRLQTEIGHSNNDRIILIGKLSELKKIAHVFTDHHESINKLPRWSILFSIDTHSQQCQLLSPQ